MHEGSMVKLYTSGNLMKDLRGVLSQEDRLPELISFVDFLETKPLPDANGLIITNEYIRFPLDWFNTAPPYLFPEEIELTPQRLLAFVFARLGNFSKATWYLRDQSALRNELDILNELILGMPVDPARLATADLSPFEEYRLFHNTAILRHYAPHDLHADPEKTAYFYEEALQAAPNDEYKAFSARHYCEFLIDQGGFEVAISLIQDVSLPGLSKEAAIEMDAAWCRAGMKCLTPPYDPRLLAGLKDKLWKVLEAFEKQDRTLEASLVRMDAAYIANISESFTEALGYLTKALEVFRKEEQSELLAGAQLQKGTLLFTWAQKGQPQFYKGAMESYQEALKIFSREKAPEIFADIHHRLGVIYAELPDEANKRGIWAGISAASFQEALRFFNRRDFPYDYAMVCNSYGNALTKFPAAVHTDNFEKALFYYQEALNIRTPEAYPLERSLTLLNYLEACWYIGDEAGIFNEIRYQDMLDKAHEVFRLTTDPKLQADATRHLEQLQRLKEVES